MLQFGLFCSLWTTLTFHLSGAPFHFQSSTIGLFGVVAIAGTLVAPIMGKRSDKGNVVGGIGPQPCQHHLHDAIFNGGCFGHNHWHSPLAMGQLALGLSPDALFCHRNYSVAVSRKIQP
jgi:hypothetical protein